MSVQMMREVLNMNKNQWYEKKEKKKTTDEVARKATVIYLKK